MFHAAERAAALASALASSARSQKVVGIVNVGPSANGEDDSNRLRRAYLTRLGIGFGDCPGSVFRSQDRSRQFPDAESTGSSCSTSTLTSLAKSRQESNTSSSTVCPPMDFGKNAFDDDDDTTISDTPGTENDDENVCDDWQPTLVKGDFRHSLLQKLSYRQVWMPLSRRVLSHQTLIIFDWDDTLINTSFLGQVKPWRLSDAELAMLSRVENAALKLLDLAGTMGRVCIITNAMSGWVEKSAATYSPGLLRALRHIRVISARYRYEAANPGEFGLWKLHAFRDVQREMNSKAVANLVSLGDSVQELDAAQAMAKSFERSALKTVKFHERPSPEELLTQLELVTEKFGKIVESGRDLCITLTRTA